MGWTQQSGHQPPNWRHDQPEAHSQTNVCECIVSTSDFRHFSLSEPSFKIAPKGNGDLHGPLACSFEQIVW
jgi:hypothetical protein